MDKYEKGATLGEGAFGVVFKAVSKETGVSVAIKKIRMGKAKEGVNVTALREIKLLKELRSRSIVKLIDVFSHKRNIYLVFEFMEGDLEQVIKDRAIILSSADIKSYMKMVLEALSFCHRHWVLHRDVKPNNFLIAKSGELKLADFGLAKIFGSPNRKYTNQVFARWYRPPELLYGSTCYSSAVDMWACGCMFAELLLRRPWFPGDSDIDQLSKIFQVLGTPTEDQWKGIKDLPQYVEFQRTAPQNLRQIFKQVPEDAIDLLQRMVSLDPSRRISAASALEHRYFKMDPQPTPPHLLPKLNQGAQVAAPPPESAPTPPDRAASPSSTRAPTNGKAAATAVKKDSSNNVVRRLDLSTGDANKRQKVASEIIPSPSPHPQAAADSTSEQLPSAPPQQLGEQLPRVPSPSPHTSLPHHFPHAMTLFMDKDEAYKPQLDSGDMNYLRKRKLDMDHAFMSATPQ